MEGYRPLKYDTALMYDSGLYPDFLSMPIRDHKKKLKRESHHKKKKEKKKKKEEEERKKASQRKKKNSKPHKKKKKKIEEVECSTRVTRGSTSKATVTSDKYASEPMSSSFDVQQHQSSFPMPSCKTQESLFPMPTFKPQESLFPMPTLEPQESQSLFPMPSFKPQESLFPMPTLEPQESPSLFPMPTFKPQEPQSCATSSFDLQQPHSSSQSSELYRSTPWQLVDELPETDEHSSRDADEESTNVIHDCSTSTLENNLLSPIQKLGTQLLSSDVSDSGMQSPVPARIDETRVQSPIPAGVDETSVPSPMSVRSEDTPVTVQLKSPNKRSKSKKGGRKKKICRENDTPVLKENTSLCDQPCATNSNQNVEIEEEICQNSNLTGVVSMEEPVTTQMTDEKCTKKQLRTTRRQTKTALSIDATAIEISAETIDEQHTSVVPAENPFSRTLRRVLQASAIKASAHQQPTKKRKKVVKEKEVVVCDSETDESSIQPSENQRDSTLQDTLVRTLSTRAWPLSSSIRISVPPPCEYFDFLDDSDNKTEKHSEKMIEFESDTSVKSAIVEPCDGLTNFGVTWLLQDSETPLVQTSNRAKRKENFCEDKKDSNKQITHTEVEIAADVVLSPPGKKSGTKMKKMSAKRNCKSQNIMKRVTRSSKLCKEVLSTAKNDSSETCEDHLNADKTVPGIDSSIDYDRDYTATDYEDTQDALCVTSQQITKQISSPIIFQVSAEIRTSSLNIIEEEEIVENVEESGTVAGEIECPEMLETVPVNRREQEDNLNEGECGTVAGEIACFKIVEVSEPSLSVQVNRREEEEDLNLNEEECGTVAGEIVCPKIVEVSEPSLSVPVNRREEEDLNLNEEECGTVAGEIVCPKIVEVLETSLSSPAKPNVDNLNEDSGSEAEKCPKIVEVSETSLNVCVNKEEEDNLNVNDEDEEEVETTESPKLLEVLENSLDVAVIDENSMDHTSNNDISALDHHSQITKNVTFEEKHDSNARDVSSPELLDNYLNVSKTVDSCENSIDHTINSSEASVLDAESINITNNATLDIHNDEENMNITDNDTSDVHIDAESINITNNDTSDNHEDAESMTITDNDTSDSHIDAESLNTCMNSVPSLLHNTRLDTQNIQQNVICEVLTETQNLESVNSNNLNCVLSKISDEQSSTDIETSTSNIEQQICDTQQNWEVDVTRFVLENPNLISSSADIDIFCQSKVQNFERDVSNLVSNDHNLNEVSPEEVEQYPLSDLHPTLLFSDKKNITEEPNLEDDDNFNTVTINIPISESDLQTINTDKVDNQTYNVFSETLQPLAYLNDKNISSGINLPENYNTSDYDNVDMSIDREFSTNLDLVSNNKSDANLSELESRDGMDTVYVSTYLFDEQNNYVVTSESSVIDKLDGIQASENPSEAINELEENIDHCYCVTPPKSKDGLNEKDKSIENNTPIIDESPMVEDNIILEEDVSTVCMNNQTPAEINMDQETSNLNQKFKFKNTEWFKHFIDWYEDKRSRKMLKDSQIYKRPEENPMLEDSDSEDEDEDTNEMNLLWYQKFSQWHEQVQKKKPSNQQPRKKRGRTVRDITIVEKPISQVDCSSTSDLGHGTMPEIVQEIQKIPRSLRTRRNPELSREPNNDYEPHSSTLCANGFPKKCSCASCVSRPGRMIKSSREPKWIKQFTKPKHIYSNVTSSQDIVTTFSKRVAKPKRGPDEKQNSTSVKPNISVKPTTETLNEKRLQDGVAPQEVQEQGALKGHTGGNIARAAKRVRTAVTQATDETMTKFTKLLMKRKLIKEFDEKMMRINNTLAPISSVEVVPSVLEAVKEFQCSSSERSATNSPTIKIQVVQNQYVIKTGASVKASDSRRPVVIKQMPSRSPDKLCTTNKLNKPATQMEVPSAAPGDDALSETQNTGTSAVQPVINQKTIATTFHQPAVPDALSESERLEQAKRRLFDPAPCTSTPSTVDKETRSGERENCHQIRRTFSMSLSVDQSHEEVVIKDTEEELSSDPLESSAMPDDDDFRLAMQVIEGNSPEVLSPNLGVWLAKKQAPQEDDELCTDEDNLLIDFPDPVDDEQYTMDCATLKEAFETGKIYNVDTDVASRMFYIHMDYLKAIASERVFCRRHEEFKVECESMRYAEGCVVFAVKNLSVFLHLMGKHFATSNEDHLRKVSYFFLVLLPELITKIIMGVYKIGKFDAVMKRKEIGNRASDKINWMRL